MGDKDFVYSDDVSSQILTILYNKYKYKYMPFFEALSKVYTSGEAMAEVESAIEAVKKIMSVIDVSLLQGKVTRSNRKEIRSLAAEIERARDFFLEQMKQSEAFREQISEIERETGVSASELNLTKKLVSKSVSRSVKGKGPSGTKGLGKTLEMFGGLKEGLKVAAFGPFTPLADVAGELIGAAGKKIGGLDPGRSRSRGGGSQTGAGVAGAGSVVEPGGAGIAGAGLVVGPSGVSDGMFHFFNERAYKAKWTSNLIGKFGVSDKSDAKRGGIGLPGVGLVSELFSRGLVKGFKAAAVAGAFAFAGREIYQAWEAWGERNRARDELVDTISGLNKGIKSMEGRIESTGLSAAAKASGMSESDLLRDLASSQRTLQEGRRQAAIMSEPMEILGPLKHLPPVALVNWLDNQLSGYKRPEVQTIGEIESGYREKFKAIEGDDKYKIFLDEVKKQSAELGRGTDKLSGIMDELNRNFGAYFVDTQQSKPTVPINQYDAADPLISSQASGGLITGE